MYLKLLQTEKKSNKNHIIQLIDMINYDMSSKAQVCIKTNSN